MNKWKRVIRNESYASILKSSVSGSSVRFWQSDSEKKVRKKEKKKNTYKCVLQTNVCTRTRKM